ncbi:MAG TPA: hypothetical protein VKB93_13580 [Thermoanaerobaculia bacterium]|nr:hypothetical protein [Thermoanaerobaculia bacterium]
MRTVRDLALLFVIALAATAQAQEFDIFDASDFLDPRIRGVEFVPDANGIMFKDHNRFLLTRVSFGAVSDYYSRVAPTGADVLVTHVATSYYRGRHQINLKLTNFNVRNAEEDEPVIPRRRVTVQWGMYRASRDPEPPKEADASSGDPIILSRYLFSGSVEDARPFGDLARDRSYEFGAEADIRLPLANVVGTLSYTYRRAVDGAQQRFAYVYRTGQQSVHRVRIDTSIGYVAQRAERWRWGNIRPVIHARIPIEKLSTRIHLAYGPTISVIGGVRVRHEVAAFVDYSLGHVFRDPRPESAEGQ